MPPTRRTLLAAVVSSFALAGCAGNGDGTDTDGAGGDGAGGDGTSGDGGTDGGDGGDESTPTATATTTATATATPSPATSAATVRVRSHADLGDILVDSAGRTLYAFDSDTPGAGASTCSGGCAEAWPPLTVDGDAVAGDGVSATLATFERADGSTQVAAGGWPLYYYAGDDGPGDANGQGVNGVWWVLRPDGTPVREGATTAAPTETSTPTETGGGDGGGYY